MLCMVDIPLSNAHMCGIDTPRAHMAWCTYLECLPVEINGLLYQSLLSLNVSQVVEGVSVIGVHSKSSVVALLSLTNLERQTSHTPISIL